MGLEFASRADYRRSAASGATGRMSTDEKPSAAERAEYSIGDLAREFDVTPRAIRFYEDQGLLAPRRDGQRRIYSPRDRTRLKLTLRGKRLGLTLSEIRELIDMYEPGRDERPQLERFLAVLESHKAALEQQRADLEAQLSEIAAFERRVRKRLGPRAGRRT
jgi:DNA-binding transcriptional MerR regulator